MILNADNFLKPLMFFYKLSSDHEIQIKYDDFMFYGCL